MDPTSEDAASQSVAIFDKLDAALEAATMSRGDIVTVQVCLTDFADLPAVKSAYHEWLASVEVAPALSCTQEGALQFGAKVEFSVLALQAPRSTGGSARVLRAGDFAFVTALDTSSDDLASQVRGVCQQIEEALKAVGMNKGQIVEARGCLKDIAGLMDMNHLYNEWLQGVDVLPAKMVHSPAALCGDARFELSVVASTDSKRGVRTV